MKSPKLSEPPGNDKLCNGGNNNNGEFCCVCLDHGCIERNLPNNVQERTTDNYLSHPMRAQITNL